MQKPYIKNQKDGWLTVGGTDISVFKTFDCGQCFRFDPVPGSPYPCEVEGVAFRKYVRFADSRDGELMVYSSPGDFENIWRAYLDLDTDYAAADELITHAVGGAGGEHMRHAAEVSHGIHILRQDRWEALCSFIVSQNNNIPRIKKIISALCKTYGERIGDGAAQSIVDGTAHSIGDGAAQRIGIRRSHICENAFPTPESLAAAGEAAIFDLRTGFRAKYICDAAEKVASGTLSLDKVAAAKSYDEAAEMLMSISGVGPKVAACTLLFGFARLDAFPIDVWIKRVISLRFPDGLDPAVFGRFAGLAQQYLFYCERYIGN